LFKISNLVLGGEAILTDFYSSLKGGGREREGGREKGERKRESSKT
jgi:hypothetical protein